MPTGSANTLESGCVIVNSQSYSSNNHSFERSREKVTETEMKRGEIKFDGIIVLMNKITAIKQC